jgi:hypothetical protein
MAMAMWRLVDKYLHELTWMTIGLIVSNKPFAISYCETIRKWLDKQRRDMKRKWTEAIIWYGKENVSRDIAGALSKYGRYESILVCMSTKAKGKKKEDYLHKDTSWIGIDTLSTYCLTNDIEDIEESTRRKVHHNVSGIGGSKSATVTYEGCGTFKVVDDTRSDVQDTKPRTVLL